LKKACLDGWLGVADSVTPRISHTPSHSQFFRLQKCWSS